VSPIESSQACIGATISCMFARMFGSDATNWLIELDSAWATTRMRKTNAATIDRVDEDTVAASRGRRGMAATIRGDDRADDEREQPRQEEREQRVAEIEDCRRR
jgi:hypothetical protein